MLDKKYQRLECVLSPYFTHGRYTTKWKELKRAVKNISLGKYHFFSIGALLAAFSVNALVTHEPEQQIESDSPGEKPSVKPKEKTIYIAGWEISTKGITMAFVTDDGEPYYPTEYKVRK